MEIGFVLIVKPIILPEETSVSNVTKVDPMMLEKFNF